MQPISHDDHKRELPQEQWVERATNSDNTRPDTYQRQEDQWAVLRQEVEEAGMNQYNERTRPDWQARDTDGDIAQTPAFAYSPYDPALQGQHAVDIVVVGVGGGGMNAINRMMSARVRGVRFVAMNTDAQVLALSPAADRVSLGHHHTKGLGAGGNAAIGMRSATESTADIQAVLGHADLVFIAAGMGGGTGTGAAPVVASIAKKLGALTIGIVTIPFTFEGSRRRRIAQDGISELSAEIDALITVPNDRLLSTVGRDRNLADAFKIADDVLRQGVQGIAEVINVPGMVNVDFADVRSVLRDAGTALMSIGQGQGRNRAQQAAEEAIAGGFLNVTIRGAKRVLFNISGGDDMTLFEVNEIAERIGQAIDAAADITFGAVVDPTLHDAMRVTLIAAGMEEIHTVRLQAVRAEQPQQRIVPPQPRTLPPQPQRPAAPQIARAQQQPQEKQQPVQPPQRYVPQPPPARPQRSLDDLRGLRSLGRHQEQQDEDGSVDVPPFLKKRD